MTSGTTLGVKPFFMGKKLTRRHFLTAWAAISVLGVSGLLVWWGWSSNSLLAESPTSDVGKPEAVSTALTEDGMRPVPVKVISLTAQPNRFIKQNYHGVITARRMSMLSAKSLGRVEKIHVDIGNMVKAGDLLVEIDKAELEALRAQEDARYKRAKSVLEELKTGPRRQEITQAEARVQELDAQSKLKLASLQRITRLVNSNSASQQEYDEARYSYDAIAAQLIGAKQALDQLVEGTRREQIDAQEAEAAASAARIRQLEVQISDTQIIAPFAGVIQQRLVDEGAITSPGQAILELVENSSLEFHVGLPVEVTQQLVEEHANRKSSLATIGDPAMTPTADTPRFFEISIGSRKLAATLDRIAPSVDDATRTQRTIFNITNVSNDLQSEFSSVAIGASGTLAIETEAEGTGFWIPSGSLVAGARGLWTVFIAKPNESKTQWFATRQQVELLRAQGDWCQVRGTLSPNEVIIVGGSFHLAPGQAVDPIWTDVEPSLNL